MEIESNRHYIPAKMAEALALESRTKCTPGPGVGTLWAPPGVWLVFASPYPLTEEKCAVPGDRIRLVRVGDPENRSIWELAAQ